jgi:hypothetical protein
MPSYYGTNRPAAFDSRQLRQLNGTGRGCAIIEQMINGLSIPHIRSRWAWLPAGAGHLHSFVARLMLLAALLIGPASAQAADNSPSYPLPAITLRHLRTLTDNTGIHEFARGTVPWHENGYCAEDVARALAAVTLYENVTGQNDGRPLAKTYLTYLQMNIRNDGQLWNRTGRMAANGDSYGRALWGLGCAASCHPAPEISAPAATLFEHLLPGFAEKLGAYPIARACAIQGLAYYLTAHSNTIARLALIQCANANVAAFNASETAQWKWFGDTMTYDTGRFPLSLLLAFKVTGNSEYRRVGLESLDFVLATCFDAGETQLCPVGNQGWYRKGGKPARFHQQPIDAASIVEACVIAWQVTRDTQYSRRARTAFEWFLGNNLKHLPLYDPITGGCHDGLNAKEASPNEGGESSIMYIIARCSLEQLREAKLHE